MYFKRLVEEKGKVMNMKMIFNVLSLVIIVCFFILNVLTPLIADDYTFICNIHSFSDIVKSTYERYHYWNGRLFANFMATFWLFVGKPVFNIANTAMYCLFIFLIQFHITGKMKYNPVIFLLINIFLWYFVPAWGQNFLWVNGSCIYFWTAIFILLFLIPFRKKQNNVDYKLNLPLSIVIFITGLFAGNGNENASAAVLLILVSFFAVKIIKKNKIALFEVLGMLGFLAGLLLLILAPGNEVRQEIFVQKGNYGYGNDSFMILKRLAGVTLIFGKDLGFILLAAFVILTFDSVYNKRRKMNMFSCSCALAATGGAFSMLLAPTFPPRAFLIVIVFLSIALGNVLLQMEVKLPNMVKRNATVILVCCLISLSASFLNTSRNFIGIYLKWNERIECIRVEKERGIVDIELAAPIPAWDKHTALWGLRDIMYDENKQPNKSIAIYFGLSSVKAKKTESDEWNVIWFK